ncbi:hypothetical protein M422DRAFT_182767, partial [Sphaerobolus stellatus SS14]
IHESDPEEWWNVFTVNIKGTYLPTREFLRRNLGRPLTIINTSSILSANTIPGFSVYYGTKSLINRFTEFLHYEYQQDGVRTFAYHPGAVGTDMVAVVPEAARGIFDDSPELAGGFTLWLTTQTEKTDFLRGRFVDSNWDVNDLLARKDEIVEKGFLWTGVRGQEQGLKLGPSYW